MPQLQAISYQNLASQEHWNCPPTGWFKVNVDAAVKIDNQRVGLGIVIRNSEGKLITAAIKPSKWLDRMDYAEAEATRFGLEVAEIAGCLPLIIETDSKEVLDLVSARKSTKAEIFWIVSEVQETMKRLKHVKLQHSPRTCNGFAHTLAKLALNYTDCVIWEDNIPTHLLYLFTELND
ncbi:uncharacterized protein LOC112095669 [Citrus clementina]|uniref:uncharacterized protein LOC112095669 n=1 Tax=Citrus clementina TaxID=85681 RepID=UPI000CED0309|nr:uncharacterized protein LOC112095669 [Citrus x clementina]